jgi:hypothetical protein
MQQESSQPQAHVTGYVLLCCLLVALVLLSAATVAGACRVGSSSHPAKTPVPAPISRGNTSPAPSKTAPKSAPSVKACPASSRYNPKTASCERIRF